MHTNLYVFFQYQLKFKKFRELYGKQNVTQLPEMKYIHKYMLYLDLLGNVIYTCAKKIWLKIYLTTEPSVFTQVINFKEDEIGIDFNQKYVDFVRKTSNR